MKSYTFSVIFVVLLVVFVSSARAVELDESAAEPGTWGYRPADGTNAEMNPPSFTWRPQRNVRGYALQVSDNANFSTLAYEVKETKWSAHCGPIPLKAGDYYWRYAAYDNKGARTRWSKARHFSVGSDAPVFPKPGLDALLERIPDGHPRLYMRPEGVDHLRDLAQDSLSDVWKQLRVQADKILKRMPDTTEPAKYPKNMQRKSGEWRSIWWGNRERSIALTGSAAKLAFAYQITGDKRYGEAARDLIMAFCEWDPKGSTNYNYNDEAAMPLLYHPSRVYTWAYDVFTPGERETLRAVMRVRGSDCFERLRKANHLWRPLNSHSNRAWHWLGEVAIAFHGDIPEAAEWLDYSTTIFFTCYPVWGGADGGWHEGTNYWASYLGRFMYWAAVSQAAFDIDPFDKPFFHQTGYFGLYTMPPGTRTGAFGDLTQRSGSDNIARVMAYFAAGARNPHWQWYAGEHRKAPVRDYLDFILAVRAHSLNPTPPKDLPTSRVFRGTGLAALNSNLLDGRENVQVHFKSSPFGRQSHGYNANNAFLLNLRGQRVFIRSGTRDVYGSPHHARWMWETRSDNAILVNGKGQRVHSAASQGEITKFHTSQRLDVVVGEAGGAYDNLDRWTRRILFFKPNAILIHDILEAPQPSTYEWLLHAPSEFTIRQNGIRWQGAPGSVDLKFLVPQDLALSQNNNFDPPIANWSRRKLVEWHLTATNKKKAVSTEFVTLMIIDDADVDVIRQTLSDGVTRVELTLPEGKAAVTLNKDGFDVQGLGISQSF